MNEFEFYRRRFSFRALDAAYFPGGKSGNVIRRALGLALRASAPQHEYLRLFEPRNEAGAPSGFHDAPRPFVVRAAHLDARTFEPGERFSLDVHFFDVRNPGLKSFTGAFALCEKSGIGPRRGRVRLERAQELDLADRPAKGRARFHSMPSWRRQNAPWVSFTDGPISDLTNK